MKRLIVSLAAMMALSSCVSLVPEPEVPSALYQIGPIEVAGNFGFSGSVLVREPDAPRILMGSDIVARDSAGSIRLVQDAEWIDRAPRLLQMALLDYLASDTSGIAISPAVGSRADYELSWRLSDFALEGTIAVARAELTLLDGKTRKPLKQLTVSSQSQADAENAPARAKALATAGQDIVRQAADFIADASSARAAS